MLKEILRPELENLILETKESIGEVKKVAISQAWKILQLIIAKIIRSIEYNAQNMLGKDKKQIAMDLIGEFYSNVFIIVDIPFVPSALESIIHKYVRNFLMILVSSSIDAMVTTFRDLGIFTITKNAEV